MKWYEGTISQAIQKTKSNKSIFVVYIKDSSDVSKTMDETLADTNISSSLESNRFVSICLENGSETARQFSVIYPLVIVPSLFFINGETGIPVEVIGGSTTKEILIQKMGKLSVNETAIGEDIANCPSTSGNVSQVSQIEVQAKQVEKVANMSVTQQPQANQGAEAQMSDITEPIYEGSTNLKEAVRIAEAQDLASLSRMEHQSASSEQVTTTTKDDETGNDSTRNDSAPSLDERVERAKILLAEKQSKKAQEEAEEERQRELERRKTGQKVAQRAKAKQDDEIAKMAARDQKKEKEDDRLARERVKNQIAQDRAEREARAAALRGAEEPQAVLVERTRAAIGVDIGSHTRKLQNEDISRLKFRLPNGSSSQAEFPANSPLSQVYKYVRDNVPLPFTHFQLVSSVHGRPFTTTDMNVTLQQLGLVPSAILIVLSDQSGTTKSLIPSTDKLLSWFWLIVTPLTLLVQYVGQFLGLRRQTSPPSSQHHLHDANAPAVKRRRGETPQSGGVVGRPQTAYGRRVDSHSRQEGIIHRLRNSDDDDENNTWNGNSTQQL